MNDFKNDLADFSFLSNEFVAGTVEYVSDGHFLFQKIMNAFPITAHRIDWNALPHDDQHFDDPYPENTLTIERHVNNIITREKMEPSRSVWVCFDGFTKGALRMSLEVFASNAGEIFTIPQHTYVIPDDVSWCMNYTFEDFLYFGYSPRSA